MSDNNFHFIPQIGKTFSSTGEFEPDIFDTKSGAKRLQELYKSIKNFGGSNYGSSSELSNTRISLTDAGQNIEFLKSNSGLLGSLLYGQIIDHVTHPRTMHGPKSDPSDQTYTQHNVYDEYRWSATLNTQGCDVSNLSINNGDTWFFCRGGSDTDSWQNNQSSTRRKDIQQSF